MFKIINGKKYKFDFYIPNNDKKYTVIITDENNNNLQKKQSFGNKLY